MIYWVRFSEGVEYLNSIGFRQVGTVEAQVIFRGPSNELAIIREPNVHGNLPENIVNDAFYTARLAGIQIALVENRGRVIDVLP